MKKRVLRKWVVVTLDIFKLLILAIILNLVAISIVRIGLNRVIASETGELGIVQDHNGK